MPRSLQECMEFHHEPERAQEYPLDVATMHIANSVAVLAEIGSSEPAMNAAVLRAVQLDISTVLAIALQTQKMAADLLALLVAA